MCLKRLVTKNSGLLRLKIGVSAPSLHRESTDSMIIFCFTPHAEILQESNTSVVTIILIVLSIVLCCCCCSCCTYVCAVTYVHFFGGEEQYVICC